MTANKGRPPPGGWAGAVGRSRPWVGWIETGREGGKPPPPPNPKPDGAESAAQMTTFECRPTKVHPDASWPDRSGRHPYGQQRQKFAPVPPILDNVPAAAAFFDLDKTVIARSSVLAFGRPFYRGGLITRRTVLKSSYARFVFAISGADAAQTERMRAHLAMLCTGWDAAAVAEIVEETVHDLIDPIIYAEAAELIAEHRAAGRRVVIVSASGTEVVEPIGALLDVDEVIASKMAVVDGRYTGVVDDYVYGPRKAQAIRQVAAAYGLDLAESFAYSDSSTDIPMLAAVGHPVAVNPDRLLRRTAAERGWPILNFARPVPLRRRIRLGLVVPHRGPGPRADAAGGPPPAASLPAGLRRRPLVGAALGTALGVGAAAGMAWYSHRRGRTGGVRRRFA